MKPGHPDKIVILTYQNKLDLLKYSEKGEKPSSSNFQERKLHSDGRRDRSRERETEAAAAVALKGNFHIWHFILFGRTLNVYV